MTAQVAITGIGAVSPNGIGREVFWRNCLDGVSGVRKITRFDADGFMVRIAGEVNDLDVNAWVEPKDRPHIPRAVPLARAAVAEALMDAGLEPEKMTRDELRGIGVSCGSGGAAQEFSEEQYRLFYAGQIKHCSVYVIPSSTPGTMASEISMHFGFRGYSHLISNGCTSSTDAIGYAYRSIKHGVMDTMIAGGTDAPIAPLILRGFQLMRIMTQRWNEEPHRGSRPFSVDRDGFVLSEGAWFFVLENEEKARARGAKIYGRIEGYGATCEAFHRVRLEESGEEPARAMELAMKEAGVEKQQIQYLQYHGTSTELNDRIESKAVQIAFGNHAEKLPGSSVKSIIGHPQGACGAAGIAAVLLSMRDGVIHPTINLEEAAPECPLDYVPNQSRKLQIEHAVANCIAFGSKNSALVLGRA
ncbi:MAG TPA: beta-ketoacyl-[acyl-carrier-protein] synthase family protein [Bryobacteraceae bacterium]|nr:beta-ketoacyl-[acyl-carrier-protein] synthase family protein [Bryobacteraceae bacterium]